MNGFWDLERTNERTDEREWIRRSQFRSAGDQKQTLLYQNIQAKLILSNFWSFLHNITPWKETELGQKGTMTIKNLENLLC